MNQIFDIIIVGAGAAGLSCANFACGNILILEKNGEAARKLGISGGGHANFSNMDISPEHYLCQGNSQFCDYGLKNFDPAIFLNMLKRWRLLWEKRAGGGLFLKSRAARLVSRLEQECRAKNYEIKLKNEVKHISCNDFFQVCTNHDVYKAKKLVLAVGSPACPQVGGKNSWELCRKIGHHIFPARPALTPLLYKTYSRFKSLAGISTRVKASLRGCGCNASLRTNMDWTDDLLFTHKGLSGPAILKLTLFWQKSCYLEVDFMPETSFELLLDQNGATTPFSLLRQHLPERLAEALLPEHLARTKSAEISRKSRKELATIVHAHKFDNLAPAGFSYAEVASGGIDTLEINPQTMESYLHKGLYILGEMQAVTGELGGYNLHWAFASAWLAARDLRRDMQTK